MAIRRVRPSKVLGGTQFSRRDFLKIGGTGLAGATLLGTAGCNIFQQSGGGQQGGGGGVSSITVNLQDSIRDLDSTTTTDSVSTDILLNVMSGLYRLDPNQRPIPDLAEDVQISDDQLTYTFTLRDGIQWSNGDPVTSQDFKYAWLRSIDPETGSQYAYIITTFVKGAAEFNAGDGSADDVAVETPDDKTLVATLVSPSPFWLGLTAFFTYLPQNQKYVEQQGEKYAQSADALLYNGPYLLKEFQPTKGITMVKNNDYWDAGNVDVPKVEGVIVRELETAVNLYESGDLDDTTIEGQYVDEFRGTRDFWSQTYFVDFYLVFNYREPFFQNENIRRAFQVGFDREALANQILNDGSEAATGYVPEGIAGPGNQTFRDAQGPVMPDYDPQKAKEYFQKGIEEVGSNPDIELLAYDDTTARDIATFLQSQFEKMGAKISVNVQPFDRKLELESNGEFQLSWQGWIADYNDPMTFMDLWLSDSSFNTQKYSSERYDQLVGGAQEESDLDKRMDMMLQAERVLVQEDAATAPMYFEGEAHLIRPAIGNYVDHQYGAGLDVYWWKLEG
jgi:oligopeptide transport system substrate-binding protein